MNYCRVPHSWILVLEWHPTRQKNKKNDSTRPNIRCGTMIPSTSNHPHKKPNPSGTQVLCSNPSSWHQITFSILCIKIIFSSQMLLKSRHTLQISVINTLAVAISYSISGLLEIFSCFAFL